MSIKLERVVKTFYDNLEQGKITGRKCKSCGAVEFPPVYACNSCGSTDTEWVELSGKGKLKSIIMPSVLSSRPDYNSFAPYAFGDVEIEEGASINALVRGITKKNRSELLEKLPVSVRAEIVQRDGYKTVIFSLEEGEK
ncbi:zinc ribbon domain-containing protein [Clostridium sp. SYSU_GA19001]|uniref:Zn-ribbon domain-containing OB-fold protein n=1 Tax=Clostridium caldaquaticum TaxID=2940653 RepID=UPI002076FD18|nr:zinc ribbon domain-containing protein [Clostridium caldaquaticum]MCM8712118.1 zinc ribbon domain-containing protein [Clostridium caldaquaticum]